MGLFRVLTKNGTPLCKGKGVHVCWPLPAPHDANADAGRICCPPLAHVGVKRLEDKIPIGFNGKIADCGL